MAAHLKNNAMNGWKEANQMTMDTILEAQEFLTVNYGDHRKTIIDINLLLRRHPPHSVIIFLQQILKEKEKCLRQLIITDRTSIKINDTVSFIFRLYMAIKTIERKTEEMICA